MSNRAKYARVDWKFGDQEKGANILDILLKHLRTDYEEYTTSIDNEQAFLNIRALLGKLQSLVKYMTKKWGKPTILATQKPWESDVLLMQKLHRRVPAAVQHAPVFTNAPLAVQPEPIIDITRQAQEHQEQGEAEERAAQEQADERQRQQREADERAEQQDIEIARMHREDDMRQREPSPPPPRRQPSPPPPVVEVKHSFRNDNPWLASLRAVADQHDGRVLHVLRDPVRLRKARNVYQQWKSDNPDYQSVNYYAKQKAMNWRSDCRCLPY